MLNTTPDGATAPEPYRCAGVPVAVCVAGACMLVLAGCSRPATSTAEQDKLAMAAVAATVNGDPIPRERVTEAIGQTQLAPEQAKSEADKILDRLIDEQVVVQRAIQKKVDRDPNVAREVEAAKRDILRRAYLDDVANDVARPSQREVARYYDEHPELFARRRVYHFRVLSVPEGKAHAGDLQGEVNRARSLADLLPWLQRQHLEFTDTATQKAAEMVPMTALPRLARMRTGQMAISLDDQGERVEIVQLVDTRLAPLDRTAASPFIEQYLINQRKLGRVEQEVTDLRASARIEKLGEFARSTTAEAGSPLILATREGNEPETFSGARR
ncbi:MAG: EpsD family peptidyl-prolyl cis-trans isomerase [Rhodocyclaceae bacterium]